MKVREPRRKVMISARLRGSIGWSDVRILNLSSRGLLVHASRSPERGSYVEICRGSHRIVARVVWVHKDRFGAHTQDAIPVDAIASGEEAAAALDAEGTERRRTRRAPSTAERLEKSRMRARSMQFVCIVAFGAGAATLAFQAVKGALGRPMTVLSAELARGH